MWAQFLREFLTALQFFTRLPITGALAQWVGYSPALLRASAAHFPGMGWIVGGLTALLHAVLMAALPEGGHSPLLAATLSTAFSVWLTGGLHEDGLADLVDGLGGGYTRERVLEIMKDSRIGAFGVMALVLVLLLKVLLLAVLSEHGVELAVLALFLAHVVSRGLPLILIRCLPHVGDLAGSKSKPLADQISLRSLCVGAVWVGLALWVGSEGLEWTGLLLALGCAGLAWLWMWRLLLRRLQGFTGDCLGATQQVCELAFYLGLVLALGVVTA